MDVLIKNTATNLFKELLRHKTLKGLSNDLYLHKGTLNRWVKQDFVPENYYNDLNHLLKNKYPLKDEYRDKDQFFTKKNIATYCYEKTIKILKGLDIDHKEYKFIEPSAGCGTFFNLLPKNRRIGIDIDTKKNKGLLQKNYLDFLPKEKSKYIVIGNPPFGLRGNLALRFINHSFNFADVVCFILPQLFESDGKGSPKKRVVAYQLAHSEKLPLNSFEYPNGVNVNIATIFQVWTKRNIHLIAKEEKKTCHTYANIYSLSDGGTPSSTRNKQMIGKCDVYLPSTTFKKIKSCLDFEELPHRRGYGVVFLKEKQKLKNNFLKTDWNKSAFLSTNSALNLRKSIIQKEIIKLGFCDG